MMSESKREPQGLYLVMTRPKAGYEETARAAAGEGVGFLQLRMKDAAEGDFLQTAELVRRVTENSSTLFIVNDSLHVARSVGADGLHLGQDDMSCAEARAEWNEPGKIIGLSTHDRDQAEAAMGEPVDYIGGGPVYATPTKEIPDPTLGLDGLKAILAASSLPVVAIGGIDEERLALVAEAGARCFAVVRAVCGSPDPGGAIRRLQARWRGLVGA